jgi:hypothetical protein
MPQDSLSAMQKYGAQQALCDLGLVSGHEKTALLGWFNRQAARPFSWLGRKLVQGVEAAGAPRAAKSLAQFGHGAELAKDMGGWALFGGGMQAAFAPEGERAKEFGKGFALGGLGGLGWAGGRHLTQMGMGRLTGLGTKNVMELGERKALFNLFGKGPKGVVHNLPGTERAKILGAKAVPFAGAMLGSELIQAPTGEGMISTLRGNNTMVPAQSYGAVASGLPLAPGDPTMGAQASQPVNPYGTMDPMYPRGV